MSPKRRRRSNIFRLGLLLIGASSCQTVDACNKGCSSCQSAADNTADNASSCDCGGNPGADGYYDDSPWYDDSIGSGSPGEQCRWPQASCDGPANDTTGCESNLQTAQTCGHCLRNCGQDECIQTDEGWFCEPIIHDESSATEYAAVAADETLLAWRTDASTFVAPMDTGEPVDLGTVLQEHVVHDGNVYGVSPAGDVVRFVFPSTTAEVIASGPSDAHMLRFNLDQVYWVQDGGIVRAPIEGGPVVPVVDIEDYEIEDYEVDDLALWLGGYFNDVPRFFHVTHQGVEHEIKDPGGTSFDSPIDVELFDTYAYFGRGNRLLFVRRDEWSAVSDIGTLPTYRNEFTVRDSWFYIRASDRVMAMQPESGVRIDLFVAPGDVGSMAIARERVFFTTEEALSSVPW